MLFMSKEHVHAMNALLADDADVSAACALFTRPRAILFTLADGPAGETVYWTMTFDRTVQFSLEEHLSPDVVLSGNWAQVVRARRDNREGAPVDPGLTMLGDPEAFADLGPAYAAAQRSATIPTDFPPV